MSHRSGAQQQLLITMSENVLPKISKAINMGSIMMILDKRICDRARLARDPRFDGLFFIGVMSTGIYCRPICPAPSAKSENIVYFPTAAAAAAAGLRACLRCRPEASPGSPAWNGISATVSRAVLLIRQGALNDGNVEDLALKLGVGSRHLRPVSAASGASMQHLESCMVRRRRRFAIRSGAGEGEDRRFIDVN